MKQMQKLSYAECEKGGMHAGELVNFTCIEKSCCDARKMLGCSVCMENDHSACRKAPLKYLCKQLADFVEANKNGKNNNNGSSNNSSNGSSTQNGQSNSHAFDSADEPAGQVNQANSGIGQSKQEEMQENLLNLILSNRQMVLEGILTTTNTLIEKMRNVQRLCIGIFDNIEKQARTKLSKDNKIEALVEKIIYSTNTVSELEDLLHKIFEIIPQDYVQYVKHTPSVVPAVVPVVNTPVNIGIPEMIPPPSTSAATTTSSQQPTSPSTDLVNLNNNLQTMFNSIAQNVSQKNDSILSQLNLQEKFLSELESDDALVENLSGKRKLDLTFSATDKHASVTLIKPNIVKSNPASSSNYKFALTNSSLPMNQVTKFAFRLQNIHSSNWIAIGVCLQKVIKSKGYSFSLNLGHGAYMISSNSGSWSHSEASNNNVVKSFGFASSSVVECVFDPLEGFLSFAIKEQPAKKYKLLINKQTQDDDVYHPCVLFYYPNDEVELIYPYP